MLALAFAFMLTGAEGPGRGDFSEYFCRDIDKPFFRESGDRLKPAREPSLADGFMKVKAAGTSRVFVLGESVATLLGDGALQEKAGRGLEVINCGMGAYDSYRIGRVFDEVLGYKPDLLVLLSGNNENPAEICPGPAAELRRRERNLLRRLYGLAGKSEPGIRASLRIQERRVRRMARAARRKGVPLVLCALPSNDQMPPYGALPLDSADFYRGEEALRLKDYKGAEAAFGRWAAAGGPRAFAEYYKALARLGGGRLAEAGEAFAAAVSFSDAQEKTSRERNGMLRRVAAEEGACFADLDAVFREQAPGGVTGFRQFTDGIHWRSSYNDRVWAAVFSAASSCGAGAAAAYGGSAPGRQGSAGWDDPEKRLSYAVSWLDGSGLHERAVSELAWLLTEAPGLLAKAAVSPASLRRVFIKNFWSAGKAEGLDKVYPEFLFHLAEALRRAGRPAEALSAAAKAEAAGFNTPGLALLRAKALHALGRGKEASAELFRLEADKAGARAAAALGAALGLAAPKPCASRSREAAAASRALSDSGARHLAAGRGAAAEKDFSAAAAADPYNYGALLSLCMIKKRSGRPDLAAEYCSLAAASVTGHCGSSGPGDGLRAAEARLESGRLLLQLGRRAEAAAAFKAALAAAPAGWAGAGEAGSLLGE